MSTTDKDPSEIALLAAARRLEIHGRHYNWWSKDMSRIDEERDPIGYREFMDVVEDVVSTYQKEWVKQKINGRSETPKLDRIMREAEEWKSLPWWKKFLYALMLP